MQLHLQPVSAPNAQTLSVTCSLLFCNTEEQGLIRPQSSQVLREEGAGLRQNLFPGLLYKE